MSTDHRYDKPSAIEIITRYISLSQKLTINDQQADEMRRELEVYGPLTAPLRARLTADDQPSNFNAVLGGAWPVGGRSDR